MVGGFNRRALLGAGAGAAAVATLDWTAFPSEASARATANRLFIAGS